LRWNLINIQKNSFDYWPLVAKQTAFQWDNFKKKYFVCFSILTFKHCHINQFKINKTHFDLFE